MTKHLRFLFVMLLAMIWSAGWAQKVTLDFSKSSNTWKLPTTSYSKVEKSYSYNGYTISFKNGTDQKGYMFTSYKKEYFLQMGETGMTLVLPVFDFNVSKIEVVGHTSGNKGTKQNIFVDNSAICKETTGVTGTNTYTIPDAYQNKGTIYKLKITSKNITRITSIKIYEKETTSTKTSTTLSLGDYDNKTFSFTNGVSDDAFTTPTATVTPAEATGAVKYTSSNNDIVTVADNGELSFTNKKFGSADISAQFIATGDYANSNTVTYTVVNKEPQKTATEVTFGDKSQQTITLTEGDVTGVVFPKASEKNNIAGTISYESSNTNVAEVDADGNVTIKGVYGESTITATFTPSGETYAVSTDWYKVVNKKEGEQVVTFVVNEDKGKTKDNTEADEILKENVTISSETAALGRDDTYRFYKNTTTGSFKVITSVGYITKIEFYGSDSNPLSVLSSLVGTYSYDGTKNIGTWTADNSTTKEVVFKAASQARATKVIVTIQVPSGIILDESEDNTIEAKTGVNVTLKRSMVANEWNTICLPFDVTEKQAKAAFGEGVKIAELDTEAAVDANVLSFKASTGIVAATPYLIKPSAVSETGTYTFDGVDITETNDKNAYVKNPIAFKGIFNMVDITKDVDNVGASYYAAFLGAGNKIYKTDGSGNKTKGFRAYFAIPNGAAASALRVVIDGTATSIKNIDSEVVESNAPVYNLQGQRVNGNNLTPGIYVKAGKKFVVK